MGERRMLSQIEVNLYVKNKKICKMTEEVGERRSSSSPYNLTTD